MFCDYELLRSGKYLIFVLDELDNFLWLLQILQYSDCEKLLFLIVVNIFLWGLEFRWIEVREG